MRLLFLARAPVSSLEDSRPETDRSLGVPMEPYLVPCSLYFLWVSREKNWVKSLFPHWASRWGLAPEANMSMGPLDKRLSFFILLV